MKVRSDFVTNSSSSSFVIINKTNQDKTLLDFATENSHLLDEFNDEYGYHYTLEEYLLSAKEINEVIHPGSKIMTFGDEQGTVIGHIYDYILRDGGSSPSFDWYFECYCR